MMAQLELSRGTLFAEDFRVERRIAEGGMGAVYAVHQMSTGRDRALKLMHAALAVDALRERFEREARAASDIDSAHVVEVHAAGVDASTGRPWLVMDLLEGESLDRRVERGPLDGRTAGLVLEQLCHALERAHLAGIIHGGLKPEKIFLCGDPALVSAIDVKVLDFGVAKLVNDTSAFSVVLGTPIWLAPEQAQRLPIGPAADIWSVGLLAFYMLTGRCFWLSAQGEDKSSMNVVTDILIADIPPASSRAALFGCRDRLPAGFDDWFARCVARAPADRFTSADETWTTLEPLLSPR
jgi:serine/threonine protein kinase